MQIGDLVRFKNNGMTGLIVRLAMDHLGEAMYTILWADGHKGNRWADELEVISENR
jgi:hypothetical protein